MQKIQGGGNSLKFRVKSEELGVGGSSSSWRFGSSFSFILSIALLFGVNSAWAADWTVTESTTLTEDKTVDALTVEEGVTLDLNGYKLTCTSLAGSGTITSTSSDLTSPQGTVTGTYKYDSGDDNALTGGSYAALFDDDFTNYGNPHRLLSGSLANGKFLTVVYDFGENAATVVNKFKLYNGSNSSSRNPYVWKFEGKNGEDSDWTTLQAVGGYTPKDAGNWDYEGSVAAAWGSNATKTNVVYAFENTTAYRYYRFVFIKTNAIYCELKQIEFFNMNPGELHVNAPDGGAVNSTVTISGNVKVVSEGTGSFTVGADINVDEFVFSDGASATLTVAEGKTLTTENINGIGKILNYGTIVKTGTGAVIWPFDNASTGLYVVSAGTVRVKERTGAGNTGSSQIIRVKKGATFDIRGIKAFNFSVVLEEGSRFVNSSSDILNNNSQAMSLSLEGDATVTHYRTFGLRGPGYGETTLNLGTYTLTLDSNGGNRDFLLVNTTISGTGTLFVKNGTLYVTMSASVGEVCTVSIGSGAGLNLGQSLTVGNFVNNGSISGDATLTVCGELTPGNAIKNLTLADGSVVKASATVTQTVSTAFSASGTIYIDASDITKAQLDAGDVPVLTVPDTFNHSGVTWNITGAAIPNAATKWKTDPNDSSRKTLYIAQPTGLMVIVR